MNPNDFIEPFVKYSRKYRELVDDETRKKVLNQWLDAVVNDCCRGVAIFTNPFVTAQHKDCEFCATSTTSWCGIVDETSDKTDIFNYFCTTCFFPLFSCTSLCVTDLKIFALLSVCYWESVHNGSFSDNLYVVWRERIRIAWNCETDNGNFFRHCEFIVKPVRCVQCGLECSENDIKNLMVCRDFNFRLFCEQCLFPKFVCIHHEC